MPLCIFYTNVPNDKVPVDFEVELSKALAEVLVKPIEVCFFICQLQNFVLIYNNYLKKKLVLLC